MSANQKYPFQVEGTLRMHALVVEDDRSLGMFLQKGLSLAGHEADWVGDGETALMQVAKHLPDLIVLDLGLPERDGTEVLREVRHRYPSVSVLVLTGRGGVEERVRCLNLGADDFLHKPFSFHELTARCGAILRRRERYRDPVLRFAEIEMDRLEHSVRYAGRNVELTAREFALLEFLLRRGGQCCTRDELLRGVWQNSPEAVPNVVDVYITYLRRKLSAAGPEIGLGESAIETVRGLGYRLRAARKQPLAVMEREHVGLLQEA